MLTSTHAKLVPELMDVLRLFPEWREEIFHAFEERDGELINRLCSEGRETVYADKPEEWELLGRRDALVKRYAKLALYRFLSEQTGRTLPWGSVTGIRPTRLAYQYGEHSPALFAKLGVSEENARLVARVIRNQEGIYERREGNVDLYVSLPFCPSKCSYCSFITAPIDRTRQFMPAYLEALGRELRAAEELVGTLRSVYVGGGTPFVLEAEELRKVFDGIAPLRKNGCEYTVEAGRPDVFTTEKLDLCKQYGVTRICINAQSFSDKTLRAIGRKHTRDDLYAAFEMAKPYGFTVNCDLIAGLTDETLEEFRDSVDRAIALSPENITVHTLCLKKGARLKEEHLSGDSLTLLGDGPLSEMIAYSRDALTAAGYEPYYLYRQKYMAGSHENVGWTKRGFASVYNVDVMEEIADNLAVGANAISKKLFLREERIERIGSPKDIPTYLEKTGKLIEEKIQLFAH